ncbi:MAG: xanthine dehydrogenase family protein molybdopterin-binding subunit, partial [Alphaproteobacteria bacterium]
MNVKPNVKHGAASDGVLGGRLSRMDGPAKITGGAVYALENQIDNLAYAVTVQSTIAAGSVTHVDTKAAEAAPGVLLVLTPDNIMPLNSATTWAGTPGPEGPLMALPKTVSHSGQHVAAVIAETLEQATAAAAMLK